MPQTPSLSAVQCPRCRTHTSAARLRRFGGNCPACLLAFISQDDLLKAPNLVVEEEIGHGGMGIVYRGRQTHLNRDVAVKVLSPELVDDPSTAERFAREAGAMARLQHPNIVALHEFNVQEGVPYLIMELVEGESLRTLLARGRPSFARAVTIAAALCDALQYAHDRGIVHRDIKPENILIDAEGRVRITDFGLARLHDDATTRMTGTNVRLGTPAYMAPEQLENPAAADHRADLYSLGVVMYEMLTGGLPMGVFKPPARLERLVLRLLSKDPARRPASAAEVRLELAAARGSVLKRASWVAVLAAAFAIGLVVWGTKARPAPAAIPAPPPWTGMDGTPASEWVSDPKQEAFHPMVRVTRDGRPVVSWWEKREALYSIRVRTWDGRVWADLGDCVTADLAGRGPYFARHACLALDRNGHPTVAWSALVDGNQEIQLKRWDGRGWVGVGGSATGGGLSASRGTSCHPVVVLDSRDHPVVAWYEIEENQSRTIQLRRWDGTRWLSLPESAEGLGVTGRAGNYYLPSLAIDAEDQPLLAWRESGTPQNLIDVARWTGTGWRSLADSNGPCIARPTTQPRSFPLGLALDGQGRPFVVFDSPDTGNLEIMARRWEDGRWQAVGNVGQAGLVHASAEASFAPAATVDSAGRPVVVWQEALTGGNDEIFLRAWDGERWIELDGSASGGGVSASDARSDCPSVAADGAGGIYVAWFEVAEGVRRVRLRRWSPAGK